MFIVSKPSSLDASSVRSGIEMKTAYCLGYALNHRHAAPDGAWMSFRGLVFYRHGAPNGAVLQGSTPFR